MNTPTMYGIQPDNRRPGWCVTVNGHPVGRTHRCRMDAHWARQAIMRSAGHVWNVDHTDHGWCPLADAIEEMHE
jgi:hypothetical protein